MLRDRSHASPLTGALQAECTRLPIITSRLEEAWPPEGSMSPKEFDSLQMMWVTATVADGSGCD